jgi:hypothetical protein
MLCLNPNYCSYEGLLIPNYEWKNYDVVFNCHFYKRTIVGADKSFQRTADKRACYLHESIIIWNIKKMKPHGSP